MSNELIQQNNDLNITTYVRDDIKNNPYLIEAEKVFKAGGYRSTIGSIWNAVVDDLRRKIMHRSLDFFNKEMNPKREVKTYEDFQDLVNDDMLIEGAYKIGVIGWEASKILKQAKENRHIFDGHPYSTEPSPIKVISMLEDCSKYVLSVPYPVQIIDINDYVSIMESSTFNKNEISVSLAFESLPTVYSTKLVNILFSKYIDINCTTITKSNIEYALPILWNYLEPEQKKQISDRVDKEILNGDSSSIDQAFSFIIFANGIQYLSSTARVYYLKPIIEKLNNNLDNFVVENDCVEQLYSFSNYIPKELVKDYVNGLTQTYVGKIGVSYYWSRTNFYADLAALKIPQMFKNFDNYAAECFASVILNNKTLQVRVIRSSEKMSRLRTLGKIVSENVQSDYKNKDVVNALISNNDEEISKFIK